MRSSCIEFQLEDRLRQRLDTFVNLLTHWRRTTNLTSRIDLQHVWSRHIQDSIHLLQYAPNARRWVDIGCGAGFPGLVIAICLQLDSRALVHLVESDRRKCAFLREAARATEAPVCIHSVRVQALNWRDLGTVDAITARAFAPWSSQLQYNALWLSQGATGLFPSGRAISSNTKDSETSCFKTETFAHLGDPEASIFRVRKRYRATPELGWTHGLVDQI
jgi:16S rRNA (guanine527-N7)-methyltransferase